MKEYTILLANMNDKEKSDKISIIRTIVGKDNVSYVPKDFDSYNIPYITIRCKKKKLKEIIFKLDLEKAYW